MKINRFNIIYNLGKFGSAVLFLLIFVFALPAIADENDPSDSYYKNSSLLHYQTFINKSGAIPIDDCFSTGKIIWNLSELDNTYMPSVITSKPESIPLGGKDRALQTIVSSALFAGVATAVAGGPALLIFLGAEILVMMDMCTNNYVVAPHEYFNQLNGKSCQIVDNIATYKQKDVLAISDIPFFYHCDPNYDPIADRTLSPGNPQDEAFIGRTYGYMGSGSQYCNGDLKKYGDMAQNSKLVGKMLVESAAGGWYTVLGRNLVGYNSDCTSDGSRKRRAFKAGDETMLNPMLLFAYYKMFEDTGKIRMCVASTRTILPLRIACGTVAPPGDENVIDPFLKAYVADSRCEYLMSARDDLKSLGNQLSETDESGVTRKSVVKFLKSDFHFTSTVIGCMKDMLIKIFIKKPSQRGVVNEKPFFQKVQDRLKQIVLSVLVLYACVVGIKIMMSPEPPKSSELIMMIIKFALVIYFATGDAFYKVDANGNVVGLFPSLLQSTDEIANMFLASQNDSDPLGFCVYKYNNKNLLGENLYQGGGVTKTVGMDGVKLTVWDLVDCKLINYLNLGSCDYTPAGLALMWIASIAFKFSGIGFILSIVSFIYCMLILLVIFKFAHIFILSLITVTILLFLSPIFIPFVLFEATKGIYNKWLMTILGYLIYPALLFALLAIMIATLDKVYYGDINLTSTNGEAVNVKEVCKDIDSIYCYVMKDLVSNSSDACDLSEGTLIKTHVKPSYSNYIGSYSVLGEAFANGLFPLMLKLMMFAFLFFLFTSSVTSFFAALLSVQDIGGMAHGAINLGNALNAAGFGAVTLAGKSLGLMKKDKEDK